MGWFEVFEPIKCCCCCPMRIGCLIIGYLGLISFSILALIMAISLGSGPVVLEDENEKLWVAPTSIIIITMILFIFLALIYVSLLIGVYTKRPRFVHAAYLALGPVSIFVSIYELYNPKMRGSADGIFGFVVGFVIQFYLILCIRAYSLTMMDECKLEHGLLY